MSSGPPPAALKGAFEDGRSVMKPPPPEASQGKAVPAPASGAGGDGPSETLAVSSGVGDPGEGPPKRQKVDQGPEKAARDGQQPAAPAAPSAPSANQQDEGENGKEAQPIQPDQSLAQAAGVKAGEQSGSRGPDPSAVQVRARGPDPSPVQGKATKVVRKRKEPEASAAWPGHPFPHGFAPPVMMPPGIMMPPAMMTPHGMMPIYGAPPAFGPGVASYGPALGKTGGRAGKEFGAGPGKQGVHPESAETKAAVDSAARVFIPESASDCLDRAVELMSHAFAKDTYIDPGKFMDDVMTRLKHKKTKDAVRESFSAAAEKLLALRKGADFKALWRQVEIAYADKETSDRVLADMLKDNPTVLAAALASDRGKSLKHACVQEAVSEARPMLNLMVGVLSKHVSVAAWNDEVRPIAEDLKTIFGKPGLFCGIATAQKEYKEAEAMRMQMAMGTIRPPVVAPVLVERKDGGTDAVQHLSLYGKPRSTPGCRCETSHCLKLFCTCFRNDVRCNSACSCLDCFNDGKHEDQRKQSVAAYRKEKEKKIHKGLDLGTAKMCAFLAQQNAQKEAGEKLKKEKIKRNRKNYTSEQVRLARKFVSEYMDTFRQQTGPKAVTFDSWVATAAGRPVASGSVYAAGGGWNGAGGGGVSSAGGSVGTVGGPAGLHPALVEPLRAGHGPVVAGPGLGVGGAEGGSGGSSMERERERSGAEGRQIVHRPYEHPKRGTFEHEAVWAKFGLLVGEVEDRAINLWERAFRELREERLQQQFDVPDHDRDAPDERQRSGGTSPNGRLVPDAVTHADLSHGMRDASIVPPDGEQAQQAPVAPPVVESQGIHGVGSPPPPPPPPVRPQD